MVNRIRRRVAAAACWTGIALLCASALGERIERIENDRWTPATVRTVADLPGYAPGKVEQSKYGGQRSGERLKATGFFRAEQVGKRWLLVDPDGYPFFSVGLCSVNLSRFPKGAVDRTFGSRHAWAEQTAKTLRECGFNTLGRWSDVEAFRKLDCPMAYTTTLSFMDSYAEQRPKANGQRGFPELTIPVFDKEFAAYCDRYARALAARKGDPWLLGHFSDNELPFRPNSLSCYLKLPPSDPGHQAAAQWLAARGKDAAAVSDEDQLEFTAVVAERYFSTVATAIKKYDPNHLYLGSRLNGKNINDGTLRGNRHADVVSVNMYHQWSVKHDRVNRWTELSGRPILNSEWYAMTLAAANKDVRGAGFRVRIDRDRGLFYQNLALGMLSNPNCVGWHWYTYRCNSDKFERGFVDDGFAPHLPMVEQMAQLNAQVYRLRDFLVR